jgi:hypothetical protein
MAKHTIDGYVINTDGWVKPIPCREFDWYASLDSYDYCTETGGSSPVGTGRTEQEAIADLLERLEELQEDEMQARADFETMMLERTL